MSMLLHPSPALESAAAPALRIGYDSRFSLGEYRGMGRYLRRLIRGVHAQAIGFCARGESDPHLRLFSRGFHFFPLWEQFSLPRHVTESGVEFLIAPYNTAPLRLPESVKLILVVHDFIYLRSTSELPLSQSPYQNLGRIYRRWNVPNALRRADRIICISEYTRDELLRRFPITQKRIDVIPNTIEASWFTVARPEITGEYVFCVSGEAPHKNLARAIEGFAEYCRSTRDRTMQFKIAGVKSAHHRRFLKIAEQQGIADRVQWVGYVSDFELQSLYAQARAFLFPSQEEGFGIPVLEALAAGVPVVASDASSIPEVAGQAALYFKPDSAHQMAEQLRSVLTNPQLQTTMSHHGRERALRFHPRVVDAMIADFWTKTLGPDE